MSLTQKTILSECHQAVVINAVSQSHTVGHCPQETVARLASNSHVGGRASERSSASLWSVGVQVQFPLHEANSHCHLQRAQVAVRDSEIMFPTSNLISHVSLVGRRRPFPSPCRSLDALPCPHVPMGWETGRCMHPSYSSSAGPQSQGHTQL